MKLKLHVKRTQRKPLRQMLETGHVLKRCVNSLKSIKDLGTFTCCVNKALNVFSLKSMVDGTLYRTFCTIGITSILLMWHSPIQTYSTTLDRVNELRSVTHYSTSGGL